MASVLAQQLQALGTGGHQLPRPKGRPSLLFADQQAADIDLQTIHDIASEGLVELGYLNEAFKPFAYTLFRQDRIGMDIDQQTRTANETVRQSIERLLTLLSPYFMRDAATKVLEYLIRQYRINEQNVDALMACALPYHTTLRFVRLVQAVRLEGTWAFMAPMQRSGAPMPRDLLAQRCVTDVALLEAVCRAAQSAAESPTGCTVWMSFYSVLVSEVLTKLPKVEERTVAQLLPFILPGLKDKSHAEYQLATYMLLMRLITRCRPAPQLFDVCVLETAKGAQESSADAAVMLLAGLFKTQAGTPPISPKALKYLLRMPKLVESLAQRPQESARFLHALIAALLSDKIHTAASLKLLERLVEQVALGGVATAAAGQLLVSGLSAEEQELQTLMSIFRSLDHKYAGEVDAAVSKALRSEDGPAATQGGADARHLKVTQFVHLALASRSARAPLQGASITIAQAIDCPSADLRRMAILQLDQMEEPDQDWLVSALLRRLADDALDVVAAVLSCKALMQVPAGGLFEAVSSTLSHVWEALQRKDQSVSSAKAKAVIKHGLALLTGAFHEAHPGFRPQTTRLLMGHILVTRSSRRLCPHVLKAASDLGDPLLSGVEEIASEVQESKGKPAAGEGSKKASKAQHVGDVNRKLIGALAQNVQAQADAMASARDIASGQGRAAHAAILALACASESTDKSQHGEVAAAIVDAALAPDSALSTHLDSLPEDAADHFQGTLPTDPHFILLSAEPLAAAVAAQHHALLLALQSSSAAALSSQPGGVSGLFRQLVGLPGAQTGSLQPHLRALLRAVEDTSAPAVFLTEQLGSFTQQPALEVQMLRLLDESALAPRKAHKAADTSAAFHRVLPALLAMASSPDRTVRAAAMDAVQALAAAAKPSSSHAEGTLTGAQLKELATALEAKRDVIEADQQALPVALQLTLQRAASSDEAINGRALEIPKTTSAALLDYFLPVLPHQHGETGAMAARMLLASLEAAAQPAAILKAGSALLQHCMSQDLSQVSVTERQLVAELLVLFTPEAVAGQGGLPKARRAAGPAAEQVLLDVLGLEPSPGQASRQSLIRLAALTQLTGLYPSLTPGHQQQLIQVALQVSTRDLDESCRAAARELLGCVPIAAAALVPLLAVTSAASQPKRGRTAAKSSGQPQDDAGTTESSMRLPIAVLELLQWRTDIEGADELLQHLSSSLPALLREAKEGAAAIAEDGLDRRVEGAYALQLALSAMHALLAEQPEDGCSHHVSFEAVMDCLRHCDDRLVQNAALSLLGLLAAAMPQQQLAHLVEVALQPAAEGTAGAFSAASMRLMSSVASAWTAQGFPEQDLAVMTVALSKGMPQLFRAPLLQKLPAAIPSVSWMQHLCMALAREAAELGEHEEEGRSAVLALASAAAQQVEPLHRLQALNAMLDSALQPDESEALHAITLEFAAYQIAAMVQSAALKAGEQQQVLQGLVKLNMTRLKDLGSGKRLGQASTGLTDALERAMPAGLFLECLVKLASNKDPGVSRRALKLLAARMAALASPVESAAAPGDAASKAPAEAASALCSALPGLLQPGRPAMLRQSALAALGTAATAFGRSHPAPFLEALPTALAAAQDEQAAVRSSAVVAVAECVSALGARCLPQLGHILDTVLGAAEASLARDSAHTSSAADTLPDAQRKASSAAAEAQSMECASAVAAVSALATGLGAFLAPQLPRVMGVLLDARALACAAHGIAASAAAARGALTAAVPPRLLLPPLYAHLPHALQAGSRSAAELIKMAERTVSALQPSAAATYAEPLFSFLQQALDVRRSAPAADAQTIERAAVSALVALVMKLNEKQFKPLFLRLHAWSTTHPAGQPDAEPLGRQAAFFGVVHVLALRLRSVFVPYYRYVIDGAIAHLTGSASETQPQPKKKRKKSSLTPADGVPAPMDGAAGLRWPVRHRVLRALQACFQFDSGAFMTPELFKRLLPSLVAQLRGGPPAEAQASLAAYAAPGEPDSAGSDVYGETAVATLVELAASTGNDELWKPFNHQVLMVTRSRDAAERARALRVIAGVVERVQENYLLLVPEMLPFLSELLEDADIPIVAATQRLLKHLEQLSGEDLAQYMKH